MNKLATIAVCAMAAFATPAMANDFTGLHVAATAGIDEIDGVPDTTDITYGATVGLDGEVAENVVVGVAAHVDNVFNRRDIGASVRAGIVMGEVMPYVRAGYANYENVFSRELDGLRLGAGLEANLTEHFFVRGEYQYTDFENNAGKHGGLLGVGVRF